jgi:hypothetical protein
MYDLSPVPFPKQGRGEFLEGDCVPFLQLLSEEGEDFSKERLTPLFDSPPQGRFSDPIG